MPAKQLRVKPSASVLSIYFGGDADRRRKENASKAVIEPWSSLDDILGSEGSLAAQPRVTPRLLEMAPDAGVTVAQPQSVILTGQTLAARVLALANYAYFPPRAR